MGLAVNTEDFTGKTNKDETILERKGEKRSVMPMKLSFVDHIIVRDNSHVVILECQIPSRKPRGRP